MQKLGLDLGCQLDGPDRTAPHCTALHRIALQRTALHAFPVLVMSNILSAILPTAMLGLGVGAAAGLLSWANDDLATASRQHRDFRILERYDGELVHIFTEVGVMKEQHPTSFFKLVDATRNLLLLSRGLDRLVADPEVNAASITFAATSFQQDVHSCATELLVHVHKFERHASTLRKHLDTIKEVAKTVAQECAHRCLDASLNSSVSHSPHEAVPLD